MAQRFNIEREVLSLFRAAKARSDFAGAATCLRLLRDIRRDEQPAKIDDGNGIHFSTLNDAERVEFIDIVQKWRALKATVQHRLMPPNDAALEEPMPEPGATAPVFVEEADADEPPTDLEPNEFLVADEIYRRDPATGGEAYVGILVDGGGTDEGE